MDVRADCYHVGWCPICSQGWLGIYTEKKTNQLFVACLECLSEWDSPKNITDKSLATYNNYDTADFATWNEIGKGNWSRYVDGKITV